LLPTWTMRQLLILLIAAAFAAGAGAQNGERGSLPPGESRDGSRPSDGAIQGGSILPGENAGVPQRGGNRLPSRCDELTGSLREECLKQEEDRDAAAGGSAQRPASPERQPSPPLTAPPQNPR
jgi:hypothetical protein